MGFLIATHNASLLVLSYFLLKEVCLALKRNVLHEIKGIFDFVDLFKIK